MARLLNRPLFPSNAAAGCLQMASSARRRGERFTRPASGSATACSTSGAPCSRGDDVAELQRRLNSLGFDAGKVDGILGPNTLQALVDFQQNRRMAEDGIAGPRTLAELHQVARATQKTGREAIREREWLRGLPPSVVGARVFLDPACRDSDEAERSWQAATATALALQQEGAIPLLSRSADTALPERIRAQRANRLGAALIVSFQLPYAETASVFFFASSMSRSEAGAMLAAAIADRLGLPWEGRAHPILKETRAPAVVVATDDMSKEVGQAIAEAIGVFFASAQTEVDDPGPHGSGLSGLI